MADGPGLMGFGNVCWVALLVGISIQAQTPENLKCEWQTEPVAIQTATPRFSWLITGTAQQGAFRIVVAGSKNSIYQHQGDQWDSGKLASPQMVQVRYAGRPLASSTTYYWAVQIWDAGGISHWSSAAEFQTGLLSQNDWSALWIMAVQNPESVPSLPLMRREVTLTKRVARAVVYIAGLGQYELHLNGVQVGHAAMAPAWSDYRKTVLYNAFDITPALRRGVNVFGVMLGNGMYNVQEVKDRYTKFKGHTEIPKLLFQAQIAFTDGTTQRIISDSNWHTVQGPTTFSSIYGGEDYDARMEQPGWDRTGFKEKDWLQAQETEGPGGQFLAQQSPLVEVVKTYAPVKVSEPKPGILVYDLGQNFSGWPQISVKGPRGTVVKLISGELLDRSGLASQRSSGGPQWFTYTLRGQGTESWHPSFSYWGFRYVQVERQPDLGVYPEIVSLNGQFIRTAATRVGTFESSSDLLNRTHHLIDAAIESNLQSVLTDCPHREKLGWLEESHLLGSALMYNFDLATLYEKISHDMADSQLDDGLIPDIAPEFTVFEEGFRDSPEWGSAFVVDPWLTYQTYGDTEIVAANYDRMKRYVAYLTTKAASGIIAYGLGDWYDIGPGEPGVSKLTSLGVTATALYYQDLITMASAAKLLGRTTDELAFRNQAADVRQAFNTRYYKADIHVYDHGSQTDYAMPLVTGLAPDSDRAEILKKLVADIKEHEYHVTAGDIGFHYVVKALMDNGRSDVLYDMLSRTDAPSYGYQLSKGATSLTEAWDANPLSSQNHFMLGHAEEWFYRGLAGIDLDFSRPESDRLIIRPSPVGDLTSAGATYDSVLGQIKSYWTKSGGVLTLAVDIPANTTAIVQFPAPQAFPSVSEGVMPLGSATYRVQPGHHVFRSHE